LADEFKQEVFAILQGSPSAMRELRFRGQLVESARSVTSNIAEGFVRFSRSQFRYYLDIALASLVEAENHLRDGVLLGYWTADRCATALRLGKRCFKATIRLKQSQR